MPEWISTNLPEGWSGWQVAAAAAALGVVAAIVSLAIAGYVLARIPADYFINRGQQPRRHPVAAVLLLIARNVLGYFLIALGIVLSLPGVPGQGLLTIVLGVMLIDFPGKHRFEHWLVSRRVVLANVNKLRARLGRSPLQTRTELSENPRL